MRSTRLGRRRRLRALKTWLFGPAKPPVVFRATLLILRAYTRDRNERKQELRQAEAEAERLRGELRAFKAWAVRLDRGVGRAEAHRWADNVLCGKGFAPDCLKGHADVPYEVA